jgi:ABC-2 type transport system permease protein
MFAWSAVLESSSRSGQVDWLIANYLMILFVNQFTYSYEHWTIAFQIRNGTYSKQLLLPYHPILQSIADNFGSKLLFLCFNIPIVVTLWMIFHPHIDLTGWRIGYFMISLFFASLIRFFMGFILACVSFWTTRSDSTLLVNDALMFLLGGQAAPIAFLPSVLQSTIQFLPYFSCLGLPAMLLLSPLNHGVVLELIAKQCIWLIIFIILGYWIWKLGVNKFQATGG